MSSAAAALRRVAIVGVSGSGKTTLGRALAAAVDAEFVELDSLFHLPGWGELPADEFRAAVSERLAADRWVVDGNYSAVHDVVWPRADTVVWLDLPKALVMRRVIGRTLRRAFRREELWNGNREPLTGFLRWDPKVSIIRWAWVMHGRYVERYEAAMVDPANAGLRFVRLRSPAEVRSFVESAAGQQV